jgi:hypothetical protein
MPTRLLAWMIAANAALLSTVACAAEDPAPADAVEPGALHVQFTNVTQKHPPFRSPYEGENSLKSHARGVLTHLTSS